MTDVCIRDECSAVKTYHICVLFVLNLPQLYDDGAMSGYIRQWKVGDMIEWRGPYGSYQYQQNKVRPKKKVVWLSFTARS